MYFTLYAPKLHRRHVSGRIFGLIQTDAILFCSRFKERWGQKEVENEQTTNPFLCAVDLGAGTLRLGSV